MATIWSLKCTLGTMKIINRILLLLLPIFLVASDRKTVGGKSGSKGSFQSLYKILEGFFIKRGLIEGTVQTKRRSYIVQKTKRRIPMIGESC